MERLEQLQLHDIYPLWHVPFWQTRLFYWTVIGILSCIVLVMVRLVIKRYWKKKTITIAPWDRALRQLRALQEKKYATKEEGKHCYFAMTEILKEYLEQRFAYNVAGMTDEELVKYLERVDALPLVQGGIKDITQGCMYIKFANQEAMQEQIVRHIDVAIKLVKQSIPQQQ